MIKKIRKTFWDIAEQMGLYPKGLAVKATAKADFKYEVKRAKN